MPANLLSQAASPVKVSPLPVTLTARSIGNSQRKATQRTVEPLTVPVSTAVDMIGVGRTTLYKLMSEGKLEWRNVGARRVVILASIRSYLGLDGLEPAEVG